MPFADKKTWEETRPSSCKDSGVGGACDGWKKNCPSDVNGLVKDGTKLAAAEKAMDAMLTALKMGEGKLSSAKDKDKEKVEPTKALIKEWRTEVGKYGTKVEEALKKIAIANRASADAEIDKAFDVVKKYHIALDEQKKGLKERVAAVQKLKPIPKTANAMDDGERGALEKKVAALVAEADTIADRVEKLADGLRTDLTSFRTRGAGGIAKDHGVDDKGQAELGKRFTIHKSLVDKFELDCKTIKMLVHQLNVDQTTISQMLDKGWEVMKGYEKILNQVLVAVKETKKGLPQKNNPGAVMKRLNETAPANAIELQLVNCQNQIDVYRKAQKRLEALTEKAVDHVPQDFRESTVLELIHAIKKEMDEFDAAKKASDSEVLEGIAHGKALLQKK
jgi:hypothetical protein